MQLSSFCHNIAMIEVKHIHDLGLNEYYTHQAAATGVIER